MISKILKKDWPQDCFLRKSNHMPTQTASYSSFTTNGAGVTNILCHHLIYLPIDPRTEICHNFLGN